jgi:hypothetical protein
MCLAYTEIGPSNLITVDYVYGFVSFFLVALGGTAIGIIAALICSFVSRWIFKCKRNHSNDYCTGSRRTSVC